MRRTIIVVTTVLLAASVYLTHVGLWLRSEVVAQDSFSLAALESFEQEESAEAIGSIVAGRMVDAYPALRIVGSGLGSILGDILATPPFEPALEAAAEDLHDRMLGGDRTAVVIDLARYENEVNEAVAEVSPALLALLPSGFFREYTLFGAGSIPDLSSEVDRVIATARLAVVATAALLALLVLIARSFGSIALAAGTSVTLAGLGSLIVVGPARGSIGLAVANPDSQTLALNLYDVSIETFVSRSLVLLVVGGILLAVGGLIRLREWRRRDVAATDGGATR